MRYYITKHDPLKKHKFDLHLVFIQSHMIYYIPKHEQLKKLGQIKITASHLVSNFELALS